ncbi:MAG: hypothetical protein CL712_05245 [Chloroflexi bacterium]|nr:hypothetical protein [Chloroflexota bacterium]
MDINFLNDLKKSLPDLKSDQYCDKLSGQVDIFRDKWGIPHIKTEDEFDAFFTQGFVTAQDRLWHMDFDRQRALGKSSKLLGKESVSDDVLMIKMGVEEASKADFEVSSKESKRMLEFYAAGVNAFIESTGNLPIEYKILNIYPEPWEPWHSLAVYKVRNMLMGTFEMKLLKTQMRQHLDKDIFQKLWKNIPADSLLTVPPNKLLEENFEISIESLSESVELLNYLNETDVGSNAWVISGDKTKSGLPLVAGDSHRALDTPSVYYQVHISCNEFSVSGYSVPGVPGAPHFSHTEHVAFGMTHGNADYQDLFVEKFRTTSGVVEYFADGKWISAEVIKKKIEVRENSDFQVDVIKTRNGYMISENINSGYGIVFSHTGTNSGTKWADCLYSILRVKNSQELISSLEEWTEPVNNFVYADTSGSFGYKLRGKIPIRDNANHIGLVKGWEEKYRWEGLIPFKEMPKSSNPDTGFVVTCNQRVVSPEYPYYIGNDFSPEYRASRIVSRINDLGINSADVEDMSSIHSDRISIPAEIIFKKLDSLKLIDMLPGKIRDIVKSWNYEMRPNSIAATFYSDIKERLISQVVKITIGDSFYNDILPKNSRSKRTILNQIFYRLVNQLKGSDVYIPEEKIEEILRNIIDVLAKKYSDKEDLINFMWGKVHKTSPVHPLSKVFPDYAKYLNPPSVSFGGDSDTPQQGGYIENLEVNSISVNRYIHDVSDWNNSRWIVPLGSSGHPGSKHYSDQSQYWAEVKTIPQLWDWNKIEKSCESKQRLFPNFLK